MLTDQEYTLLKLRGKGLTTAQLVASMGITLADVHRISLSIREKLALPPGARLDAVARAMARLR